MGCRGHFGPQEEFSGWNTANLSEVLKEKKTKGWVLKDVVVI